MTKADAKKTQTSQKRAELRAQLSQEMKASKAPGREVADRAIQKPSMAPQLTVPEEAPEPERAKISTEPKHRAKSSTKQATTRPTRPLATKVSVSLYQDHLDQIERIKDELRRLGHRSASDSMAVRIALNDFQPDSGKIARLLQKAKEQDGRLNPK